MNLNSYRADEPHVGHGVYEHVRPGKPYRRGTITREGAGTWDVVLDRDASLARVPAETFTVTRDAFTCLEQGHLAGMMFWGVRVS